MVFSALALAQSEVLWYFQHAGIASSRSKAARVIPVDIVSGLHERWKSLNIVTITFSETQSLGMITHLLIHYFLDPNDPTIGFLLDGMDRLCCLVRKYIAGLLLWDIISSGIGCQ